MDIKVALGVDCKSNTCDEGQDDIPEKAVMHPVDVRSVNLLSNKRRFQKSGENPSTRGFNAIF